MKNAILSVLLSYTAASVFHAAGQSLVISPARAFPDFAGIEVGKAGKAYRAYFGIFDCADLNGDGRMDALVYEGVSGDDPSFLPALAVVFLQDPAGNLVRQSETYELPITQEDGPRDMLLTDVNEDGKIDCLMTDKGEDLILMLGKGGGTFQPAKALGLNAVGFLALGDFNKDGHIDLAGDTREGAAMVFLGAGNGTFAPGVTLDTITNPFGERQGKILVGDINHDGNADIAVASTQDTTKTWTGNLDVFLGKGDGTFHDPIRNPDVGTYHGALGDFDGDGNLDYAGDRYSPEAIEIWLGQGNGTFKRKTSYSMDGFWPGYITVGEINGDAVEDLIIASVYPQNKPAPLAIFLGNGDGSFRARKLHNPLAGAGTSSFSPKIIDMNSDGLADIFCVTLTPPAFTNNSVVINLNKGSRDDFNIGVQVSRSQVAPGISTLESSTDLKAWTPIKQVSDRRLNFVDTRKDSPTRFYRTRKE